MPKQVCRIRWRKGEPLSFVKYAAPTFLDLPREIRDRIYYELLVSPDPITVCSMDSTWSIKCKDGKYTLTETTIVEPITSTCPLKLARALTYSCRQVAAEATATFYAHNTFKFTGHEAWQPMYAWLSIIGESNRAHLRSLVADLSFPAWLAQDENGSHRFHNIREAPWQLHRVERSYNSSKDRSWVHYLSPAIEACFRILGKVGNALTLRFILPKGYLPGVMLSRKDWDSLAIPELVEMSRTEFTARRVVVLWEGIDLTKWLLKQQAVIKSKGWQIVEKSEGPQAKGWEIVEKSEGPPPSNHIIQVGLSTTIFTARRVDEEMLN